MTCAAVFLPARGSARNKGSRKTAKPVSSSALRFEMTCGPPPETASMNFEGSRWIVWVIESLTAVAAGPSASCRATRVRP
jgi:hypothetical protein